MNEAVCGIGIALLAFTRSTNYTDGIAYLQGSREPALPELIVNLDIMK